MGRSVLSHFLNLSNTCPRFASSVYPLSPNLQVWFGLVWLSGNVGNREIKVLNRWIFSDFWNTRKQGKQVIRSSTLPSCDYSEAIAI